MRATPAFHIHTHADTMPYYHTIAHYRTLSYTKSHQSTLPHTKSHQSTLSHTKAHSHTPKRTKAHYHTRKHTLTHQSTPKHTKAHYHTHQITLFTTPCKQTTTHCYTTHTITKSIQWDTLPHALAHKHTSTHITSRTLCLLLHYQGTGTPSAHHTLSRWHTLSYAQTLSSRLHNRHTPVHTTWQVTLHTTSAMRNHLNTKTARAHAIIRSTTYSCRLEHTTSVSRSFFIRTS